MFYRKKIVSSVYGFDEDCLWYDSACVVRRTLVVILQRLVPTDPGGEMKIVTGLLGRLLVIRQ